ncbi:hypothetical protein ASPVEDRAFT_123663 [Aspergillus versicolor CBS 583.65]|uniref:NAD(P)-binding domain-containing protein n=1 Tax=Aspergillus versicolor CBS 583.65 TaxID=1036611 RepID=A0A1L9PD31_ASPVE|nr:uncharacterized protein ASPVEDRAFT_123663 [Aspergillus versicolor CBS 583.65]OJI99365.1 hypothetical protein ASPVEDRAFT_123663 [Aspergillus versicolor CBS 583.65]
MSPTIVLITGANRGIGRGLLERYIAKPNHTVIAANRDPKHSASTELLALPTAEGTTVKVVKLDVTSETDGENAARELKELGINHVDILIANAAIGYVFPKLEMARLDDIRTHFETNVIGFARTYQAFFPFLQTARDRHPKLVTIGSISRNTYPAPNSAYGATKVVQHWYTRSIALQEPWLTAFPIDPGFVQSDLGNFGASFIGLEKAPTTIEDSTRAVVEVIDASTRETHSGRLWKWTGEEEPW